MEPIVNQESSLPYSEETYLKENYPELYLLKGDRVEFLREKQIELINNNALLADLINNNPKFIGKTSDTKCIKNKYLFPADYITKSFSSANFKILWNPNTFKMGINKKPEKGDYRCSYKLNVENNLSTDRKTVFDTRFNISLSSEFKMKKWKANTWKKTGPNELKNLVYHSLNFALQNHVLQLAKENLVTLLKIESFKNIPKKDLNPLVYKCDETGRVIFKGQSEHFFSLQREKISHYNFLVWTTNDLKKRMLEDSTIDQCSIKVILKWCVISKTVDMLALQLNENDGLFKPLFRKI